MYIWPSSATRRSVECRRAFERLCSSASPSDFREAFTEAFDDEDAEEGADDDMGDAPVELELDPESAEALRAALLDALGGEGDWVLRDDRTSERIP